jgi:hypothetical protein
MSRKRFLGLLLALMNDLFYIGHKDHLHGIYLKWYRDFNLSNTIYKSYAECWDGYKPLKDIVNEHYGYPKYI